MRCDGQVPGDQVGKEFDVQQGPGEIPVSYEKVRRMISLGQWLG